jgi:hypothetical protein
MGGQKRDVLFLERPTGKGGKENVDEVKKENKVKEGMMVDPTLSDLMGSAVALEKCADRDNDDSDGKKGDCQP